MIYANWNQFSVYPVLLPEAIAAIAKFMNSATPELPDATYPLLDSRVKASVFSYQTKLLPASVFEIHREYLDIQTLLAGKEINYCRETDGLQPKMALDTAKDYQLFEADLTHALQLHLLPGSFVVYFPMEAHLTALAIDGQPAPVKKIVLKVHRSLQQGV